MRWSLPPISWHDTPVTITVVVTCVVVWVVQLAFPAFDNQVALLPSDLPTHAWTLLSDLFAHASDLPWGIAHIGLNLMSLVVIAPGIERLLGWQSFLVAYLVGGLGGNVAYLLPALPPGVGPVWCQQWWDVGVVGASGAIFALLGVLFPLHRLVGSRPVGLWIVVAVNLILGFAVPGVAWQAHLGGLAVGLVVGTIMANVRRNGATTRSTALLWLVPIVLLALVIAKYVWLAQLA